MNIEVYTICYNESKFINLFLNYYAQFASKIIIYDNYSTDDTCDKINRFNICPTEIIKYDTGNQIRDDIYLEIKNNCWKNSKADYVIVCDVDEILYHQDLLNFLKNNKFNVFKPMGFNMVSDFFPSEENQIINQVKTGVFDVKFSKCILFKPNELNEINFGPGCHKCFPTAKSELKLYDSLEDDRQLKLLHYKNISFQYRMEKNKAFAQRLSDFNRLHNMGFHYLWDNDEQYAEYLKLWNHRKQIIKPTTGGKERVSSIKKSLLLPLKKIILKVPGIKFFGYRKYYQGFYENNSLNYLESRKYSRFFFCFFKCLLCRPIRPISEYRDYLWKIKQKLLKKKTDTH